LKEALVTVTLRVFFYGLLMFNPSPTCDRLQVEMADAHHPPAASDGCPLATHQPVLLYEADDLNQCADPCSIVHGLCRCELDHVRISVDGHSGTQKPRPEDRCGLAGSAVEMARLRWFWDRGHVATRVKSVCDDDLLAQGMGRLVQAEAIFNPAQVGACEMARAPGGQLAHYEFVPLTHGILFKHEQTLATVILATETLEFNEKPSEVKVRLSAYGGLEEDFFAKVPIVPCNDGNGDCADIVLANLSSSVEYDVDGRCSAKDVDRHVELYHELINSPPDLADRSTAHLSKKTSPFPAQGLPLAKTCGSSALYNYFRAEFIRNGEHHQVCATAVAP
jgi:hypothetical protein